MAAKFPEWSAYNYVLGNPVMLVDPDGKAPIDPPNLSKISEKINKGAWADYYKARPEWGRIKSGNSPYVVNCWQAVVEQIQNINSSVSPDLASDRINMYEHDEQNVEQSSVNLQKGVDVIVKNLKEGNGVMAGVMYNSDKNTGNDNRATNHYITIIGMGEDENGKYFSYYDNYGGVLKLGSDAYQERQKVGTDLQENRLYFDKEKNIFVDNTNVPIDVGRATVSEYILTEVRDNHAVKPPKKSIELDWNNTCFVKGTKILMADGTEKNIESVKEGDLILSVNMNTFQVEKDIVKLIPKTIEHYAKIELKFENGVLIETSPHHPFYVKGKGWCVFDVSMAEKDLNFEVRQLEKGDIVYLYVNGKLEELRLSNLLNTNEIVEMFNLKYVEKNNTFFANRILVHNRYNKNKSKNDD